MANLIMLALAEFLLVCVLPSILLLPLPSLWVIVIPLLYMIHTAFLCYYIDYKFRNGVCRSTNTLHSKTVIITGANSGIGLTTSIDLARRGARVILACRNEARGLEAQNIVRTESNNENVHFKQLDLSSLASIRLFSEKILQEEDKIHILINNAGIFNQKGSSSTVDGFELTFGVNHLGPFYLTHLLLDRLKESHPSRIVNVASIFHKFYSKIPQDSGDSNASWLNGFAEYCHSKLANVLTTLELADRLQGTGVSVYSLHPGMVSTNISQSSKDNIFQKTPQSGAQTTIYCAVSDEVEDMTGMYFSDCKQGRTFWYVNKQAAQELWEMSERLLNIA